MLRFLRQYNKIFLGVFGVLLLLAWAVGGSLSQISNYTAREGTAWATIGPTNKKVTLGDLEKARRELAVIDELKKLFQGVPFVPVPGADSDPAHWYLLTQEATEAGLVGGEQDATMLLDTMAAGLKPLLDAEELEANADTAAALIAARSGASPLVVRQTIAKINGMARLRDLLYSTGHFSDTRLRAGAAEMLTAVNADVVALDAFALTLPEVPAPTDAELEAQLRSYADVPPPAGSARGFGYRLPDRVELEWLQISEAQVRAAVAQSAALDSVTLKKKFAEAPDKFGVPAGTQDPLTLYSQYESTVRSKVLDELVAEKMREITKFAVDAMAQTHRGLKRDGSGLYVLPADWDTKRVNFQTLSNEIATQFKINPPAYGSTGTVLRSIDDLRTMPGVGSASTDQFGNRPMTLPNLVAALKEFAKPNDIPLTQAGIALPPLTASNKDIFLVRVVRVDPSRAPNSIDEVRDALVRDVTAIKRFEAIDAQTSALKTTADADGLFKVASDFGTAVQNVAGIRETNPQGLQFGIKFSSSLPGIGSDPDVSRDIVARTLALPRDPATPLADLPAADRTFVISLPKKLAVLVVRVTDLVPLTQEDFEPLVSDLRTHGSLAGDGYQEAIRNLFSLDALMARHNFKLSREGKDAEGEDAAATDKSAEGATTPAGTAG
jgi:hypothetical protein